MCQIEIARRVNGARAHLIQVIKKFNFCVQFYGVYIPNKYIIANCNNMWVIRHGFFHAHIGDFGIIRL